MYAMCAMHSVCVCCVLHAIPLSDHLHTYTYLHIPTHTHMPAHTYTYLHTNTPRQSWEKIGTVMGGDDTMAPATKMFNGQVFDYVFDVDVEDGVPPRKLALNRGDNPYDVADSFLIRENLPVSYRYEYDGFERVCICV